MAKVYPECEDEKGEILGITTELTRLYTDLAVTKDVEETKRITGRIATLESEMDKKFAEFGVCMINSYLKGLSKGSNPNDVLPFPPVPKEVVEALEKYPVQPYVVLLNKGKPTEDRLTVYAVSDEQANFLASSAFYSKHKIYPDILEFIRVGW